MNAIATSALVAESGLQWSSKTYRFERGQLPLPPLIRQCCHQLVRAVPWQRLFANVDDDTESQSWHHDYEPEGGVVNFYQVRAYSLLKFPELVTDPVLAARLFDGPH